MIKTQKSTVDIVDELRPVVMSSKPALQIIILAHRPVKTNEEIDAQLDKPLKLLLSAAGVIAAWQGSKFEELYTRVYLLLWKDLESSHRFFTSSSFDRLITDIQPALNGRKITWKQHTLLKHSSLSDLGHFDTVVQSHSGAIEVAWTKVVEGKVAGYYEQFDSVVQAILENEPGCDGFFLSPQIEDPQSQVLLINWKSVDAHHVEFENKPTFRHCIDALYDFYGEFVVPWHIVGLRRISGDGPGK